MLQLSQNQALAFRCQGQLQSCGAVITEAEVGASINGEKGSLVNVEAFFDDDVEPPLQQLGVLIYSRPSETTKSFASSQSGE